MSLAELEERITALEEQVTRLRLHTPSTTRSFDAAAST